MITATENSTGGWIATFSGLKVTPLKPTPEMFNIEDIAHSLAQQCRFTGHTHGFMSVAQHSIMVSETAPKNSLWGLLHDASEAFIGDLASPTKYNSPLGIEYRIVEDHLMRAICQQFRLHPCIPGEVERADLAILTAEARDFMPSLELTDSRTLWGGASQEQKAWVAGYFEGEGCFAISQHAVRQSTNVRVSVCSTDLDVLIRLRAIVGGGNIGRSQSNVNPKHKLRWVWQMGREDRIRSFIEEILPNLGSRRTKRAKEALEILDSRTKIDQTDCGHRGLGETGNQWHRRRGEQPCGRCRREAQRYARQRRLLGMVPSKITPWSPEKAERMFLKRYYEITEGK